MSQIEMIAWIKKHAPLEKLCEQGGWPDPSRISVEILSQSESQWTVDIEFTETIMEISECSVSENKRGGEFVITCNKESEPTAIRMTERLWSKGDTLL